MSEKLKPCPFCGGHERFEPETLLIQVPWDMNTWTVRCGNCDATCGYEGNEPDAVIRWNDRPEQGVL